MLRDYADITSRLGAPAWHDGQGVPRYAPFHPSHCGVYDRVAALLVVRCQACDARFRVATEFDALALIRHNAMDGRGHAELPAQPDRAALSAFLEYGDPPPHPGCPAGVTMNSVPESVVELWVRSGRDAWTRHPEHEGPLPCAWADDDG